MMKRTSLALVIALFSGSAFAQDIREGQEIFEVYCTACHGLEGRGNGPMSAILTLLPTDLTQLSRESGGEFPTARVVARIDGRDPLVAHGSPMPVFGEYFEGRGVALSDESGQRIMTSQPVVDLVEYLRDIQE